MGMPGQGFKGCLVKAIMPFCKTMVVGPWSPKVCRLMQNFQGDGAEQTQEIACAKEYRSCTDSVGLATVCIGFQDFFLGVFNRIYGIFWKWFCSLGMDVELRPCSWPLAYKNGCILYLKEILAIKCLMN